MLFSRCLFVHYTDRIALVNIIYRYVNSNGRCLLVPLFPLPSPVLACRRTPGTSGENSPHDFLAVRKTVWVLGTLLVFLQVMLKWSTAQAAIFKHSIWKRRRRQKITWCGNIKNLKSFQASSTSWDYPFKRVHFVSISFKRYFKGFAKKRRCLFISWTKRLFTQEELLYSICCNAFCCF